MVPTNMNWSLLHVSISFIIFFKVECLYLNRYNFVRQLQVKVSYKCDRDKTAPAYLKELWASMCQLL